MHRSSSNTTARWVKVGEGRELASNSIGIELGHGDDLVSVVGSLSPGVSLGLRTSSTSSIPVVEPGDILLSQSLEYGLLGESIGVVSTQVGTVTSGGTGGKSDTVWVSGLDNG